jgi:Fungal Zn(2)-Cys(6) binuclear cluster domain
LALSPVETRRGSRFKAASLRNVCVWLQLAPSLVLLPRLLGLPLCARPGVSAAVLIRLSYANPLSSSQFYPGYPSTTRLHPHPHPLPSASIPSTSSTHYASPANMSSPVHKQPAHYYYSQAPPSSHSPQHHSHSHSHSQASTPFTTASSVHSPPLSHQLAHPPPAIGYPPFNPYSDQPTSHTHTHTQPYSSNGPYHPSGSYDGYGLSSHNALQLQPPPLDTSVAYHPSLPSAGGGGAPSYIPARPSPLQHSHSQRMIPGVHQMGGRGQPAGATHPHAGQALPGMNSLPPIGSGPSGVSAGTSAAASSAPGQSAPPATAPSAVGAEGQPMRKRPKYTRSKAGCLVCRQKKVKCDEKKPTCTRCLHGHREVGFTPTCLFFGTH